MYAIVEIAGKQYKVQENDKLIVPHLKDAKVNDTIDFDRVLLVADDGDVKVGTPLVADATMSAKVLEHVKADKVLVYRKIRRKRFKVMKGHRQRYTRIEVSDLSVNGGDKKAKKAKKAEAAEAKKSEAAEAKKAETAEAKKSEAAEAKKTEAAEAKKAEAADAKASETADKKAAAAKAEAAKSEKAEIPEVQTEEAEAAASGSASEAAETKTAKKSPSPEAEAGPSPVDTEEAEESSDEK